MRLSRTYLRGLGAGIVISAVLMGITASSSGTAMSDEEIKKRAASLGMVEEESVLVKQKEVSSPEVTVNPADDASKEDEIKTASAEPEEKTKDETDKPDDKQDDSLNTPDIKMPEDKDADKPEDTADPVDKAEDKNENAKEKPANEDLAMGGTSEAGDDGNAPNNENTGKDDTEKAGVNDNPSDRDGTAGTASGGNFTLQIAAGSSSYTVAKLLAKGGAIDDADDFDRYLCEHGYDHRINHGVFKIPAGAGYDQIARIITGNK
ncbi:MAG: hypothetical protein K6F34_07860 [Lachnospiraceae bacterium]|nr:hypothetical protein [Lachnospiraceae bacterium]